MKTSIRFAMLSAALGLGAGCAPHVVAGTMGNPAKTQDKLQSAQEYDIGPYKENHRYAMTVKDWTPSSIGIEIKLADIGDCALPKSYSYTLVDDAGGRHAFRPVGDPTQTSERGAGTATLTVSTQSGTFDATIGPEAHAITIEQRPQPSVSCPALDFRWTFQ